MTPFEQRCPRGPTRRAVLRLVTAAGFIGLWAGSGLRALAEAAAAWPEDAFKQKSEADALGKLYGKEFEASDKVTLDVPEIAENGAVVPVSVSTSLPNVTSLTIMVPENPFTIAASYRFAEGTMPAVSCRLKMAKTSAVVAVVESDGKLFATSKSVKVTLGGCGG
jgi:sulfur-oxidizing protein SoxY